MRFGRQFKFLVGLLKPFDRVVVMKVIRRWVHKSCVTFCQSFASSPKAVPLTYCGSPLLNKQKKCQLRSLQLQARCSVHFVDHEIVSCESHTFRQVNLARPAL